LYVDRAGMMWLATAGSGLDRYDPLTGQFTHYQNDPEDPASLASNQTTYTFEDRDGNLWVGTDKGVDYLDPKTGQFHHLKDDPLAPKVFQIAVVRHIMQDSAGRLWFSTTKGLIHYDPAGGKYRVFQNYPGDPASLNNNNVSMVIEDHSGTLWVATRGGGLDRFDPARGEFQHFVYHPDDPSTLSNNVVMFVYEDSTQVIWAGTWGGGLNRLDAANLRFIRYKNETTNPNSLTSDLVTAMFEDQSGSVWVSTWGAGLSRFDHASEQFIHYRSNPEDPNSLAHPMVWSIYAEGEILWVGTQVGLDRLDRHSGQVQHIDLKLENAKDNLKSAVYYIYRDRSGYLWLAVDNNGLNRFDPRTGEVVRYKGNPDGPDSIIQSSLEACVMLADGSGQLWVGTKKGLVRLDPQTGEAERYTSIPQDLETLSANVVNELYLDRSGYLWVGTENGLNRLDLHSGKFTRYLNDPENPHSLSANRVLAIQEDKAGRLWIGTSGGGVNRFDPQSGQFKAYREKEGLPNDTVYGVLEDENGELWMSTNRGLARFNPQVETFKNYDARDGLQANEFNSHAFYKSASGELFFGGINGVTVFYPKNIAENTFVPPVRLVSLTQSGQPVAAERGVEDMQAVSLPWPNNFFEFEFVALSYIQSDQNQYAYKLEGFDREWNYTGSSNLGRYTNLPGGTYELRMKASNNDGVWNEQGTHLRVQVVPPFWQTLWFRGGALVLFGLIGLGGYRWRVRSMEQRNRQLEGLVDERTREMERRHQELEALYLADEALHRNLHLDQVLQALVDSAVDLLHADKGSILVWDEAHLRLTARVTRGFSPESVARLSFGPGEGVAGTVAVTGEPILIQDVREDERVSTAIIEPEGIRSFMQVPIRVGGEVFGVFSADFLQPRSFAGDELRLLTSLAQRAAQAIQNAQLYEHTQEQAVAEERNRLARELHDAVTQTLFSASLLAEALPAAWDSDPAEARHLLGELRQLSRGALAEMRTLLMELRPSALAEADLGDLLRQLGEAAAGREGIPVTVTLDGRCTMPTDAHIALYRIAQEALNNALKHARASQITLNLLRRALLEGGSEVMLTVRDDGRGFDPERVAPNHFGLGIMRERAEAIGATLTVESQPGCGTQITVLWEDEPVAPGENGQSPSRLHEPGGQDRAAARSNGRGRNGGSDSSVQDRSSAVEEVKQNL